MRAADDLKLAVASMYDTASVGFAGHADRQVYERLAQPLVRAIGPVNGTVLDVAAGSGALGRAFDDVVAVDLSAGQLVHNEARWRVRADAEYLPFANDAFAAAGCAFGVNHVPHPEAIAREMARVAPVIAVSTWRRPEVDYLPKQIVTDVLTRHLGAGRSQAALRMDVFNDAVGGVDAVRALLVAAAVRAEVREIEVEIPWPGVGAYLDYRLSMPSAPPGANSAAIREVVTDSLAALRADELVWRPHIIVGVGRR